MQLVTSLIHVMSGLMDARDTAQRQLEAEQKRKGKVQLQISDLCLVCCPCTSNACSRVKYQRL